MNVPRFSNLGHEEDDWDDVRSGIYFLQVLTLAWALDNRFEDFISRFILLWTETQMSLWSVIEKLTRSS
jgi:hypothetical protein